MGSRVVVRGANLMDKPLLDTKEALYVEIYDDYGNIIALLHRVFGGKFWAATTAQDPDFNNVCKQLGVHLREQPLPVD